MHPLSQLVWSANGHRLDDNTTTRGVPMAIRLASALLMDHRIQYPWDLRLVRTMMRSEKLYRCRVSHASTEGISLRLNLEVNVEQKTVTFSVSESRDAKHPHRYLIAVLSLFFSPD